MTIYETTPGALIATEHRTVSTFASGLCRVDQKYVCATSSAPVNRAILSVGSEFPDGDDDPAIDGLYIFPAPQEVRRNDGFTDFQVSAYGRTSTAAFIETAYAMTMYGTSGDLRFKYSVWSITGSIAAPTGASVTYGSLGLDPDLITPFGFILTAHPEYQTDTITQTDYIVGIWEFSTSPAGDGTNTTSYQTNVPRRKYHVTFKDANGPVGTTIDVWVYDPNLDVRASRYFGKWTEIEFSASREQ